MYSNACVLQRHEDIGKELAFKHEARHAQAEQVYPLRSKCSSRLCVITMGIFVKT